MVRKKERLDPLITVVAKSTVRSLRRHYNEILVCFML